MAENGLTIPKQRERLTPEQREYRRCNANLALQFFAPETFIQFGKRGEVVIAWEQYGGRGPISRRWQVRHGQDFYPVWNRLWGHGGTCCTALSQLVRWVRGQPVLPLATWHYWCGEGVALARDHGQELIDRLKHAGYPEEVLCVVCGEKPTGLDWFNLDGVSGPCCRWVECRHRNAKST